MKGEGENTLKGRLRGPTKDQEAKQVIDGGPVGGGGCRPSLQELQQAEQEPWTSMHMGLQHVATHGDFNVSVESFVEGMESFSYPLFTMESFRGTFSHYNIIRTY